MPPKKSAKKAAAPCGQDSDPTIALRQKEAIAAANQIRKDFKNLKLSKSAKLFNECISKHKEFEAELKLVRLELLATIHGHEESTYDPKVEKFALKEMVELIDDMAQLQPCWGHAAERCCTLLRVNAGDPLKGAERCAHAISSIQRSRPTDDRVFLDVFSQDHEANLHRLLDFDCKEDVQYLIDRLNLAHFLAMQDLNKKAAVSQQQEQQRQQIMQWQVQHQTAGGLQQDSEPDPELAPHAVLQPQQLPEQLPLPLQDQQPPAGASEHDVDLELGQESPLPSVGWQPENGLDLGAAGGESGKDGGAGELLEADDDGGGEGLAQDPQTAELQYQHHLQLLQQQEGAGGMQYVQNQNGQMVPWQGGEDGENGGDTAVLQRLQTSVIKRRNALVQLYKQGLRRPPKRSKAVSGADDKDDQAKQIRRKMIEQDLVRVRAMQLCREAGQEPQVDSQADDGEGGREGGREGGSKRSGSDAKSHSERLQRKLAAKKEALGRSDAAGFDSAERAERFLQTLPGEQREEALRLPLERLQEVFAQVAHAQAEQLAGESGGQAALCDTVPCLIAAADERAQGQWIARSWVNGDFQRFTNRQEYASTLLTMVWRLLLQKCKGDVLARWHHAPEPPEEGKEERWPGLEQGAFAVQDFQEVLPWYSRAADALPDLSKGEGEPSTLPVEGEGSDHELHLARMKRYLMSRIEHMPPELLGSIDRMIRLEGGNPPEHGKAAPGAAEQEPNSKAMIDLEALNGDDENVHLSVVAMCENEAESEPGAAQRSNGIDVVQDQADVRDTEKQYLQSNNQGNERGIRSCGQEPHSGMELLQRITACVDRDGLQRACMRAFKLEVRDNLQDLQILLTSRVGSVVVVENFMPLDCERLLAKGYHQSLEDQCQFSQRYRPASAEDGSADFVQEGIAQVQCPEGQEEVWFSLHERFDGGPLFHLALLHETLRLGKMYVTSAWNRADTEPSPAAHLGLPIYTDKDQRVIDCQEYGSRGEEDGNVFNTILQGECIAAWLQRGNHILERGESRPIEEVSDLYERCEHQNRQLWSERVQEFTHRGMQWTAICRTHSQVRHIHGHVMQMRNRVCFLLEHTLKRQMENDGQDDAIFLSHMQSLNPFLADVLHFSQMSRQTCQYLRQGLQDHSMVVWYRLQDAFRHMEFIRVGHCPDPLEILNNDPEVQRDIEAKISSSRKIAQILDEQINQTAILRDRLEQFAREQEAGYGSLEFQGSEPLRTHPGLLLTPALSHLLDQIDGEASEIESLMKELYASQMEFDLFRELDAVVNVGTDSTIVTEAVGGLALAVVRDNLAERGRAEEKARAKLEQDNQAKAAEEELLQEEMRREEQERQKREKAAKKRDKDKEKKRKEKEEQERRREEEEKALRDAEEQGRQQEQALRRQEEEEREAAQRKAREAEEQEIARRRKELEEEEMRRIITELKENSLGVPGDSLPAAVPPIPIESVSSLSSTQLSPPPPPRPPVPVRGQSCDIVQVDVRGVEEAASKSSQSAIYEPEDGKSVALPLHGIRFEDGGSSVAMDPDPLKPSNDIMAASHFQEGGRHFLDTRILQSLMIQPSNLHVGEAIGSGAHGVVRKGVLMSGGKEKLVAIKIFPELVGDMERKRFNVELRALVKASMQCQGVTKLYGTCCKATEDGRKPKFCLVMELYPRSMADLLQDEGVEGLREDRVIKYLSQLCRTLSELHDAGIVHQDLKPQNLLLSDTDDVVIGDFGIAHVVNKTLKSSSSTVGDARGTFNYMAPEAFNPSSFGGVTPKLDMWSLACCAVEMLTGQMPFSRMKIQEILFKVCVEKTHPEIPPNSSIAQLLASCFHHNPNQRISSTDMLHGLQKLHQRTCAVCLDEFGVAHGLQCAGNEGPPSQLPPHFTCFNCLRDHILNQCNRSGAVYSGKAAEFTIPCVLEPIGCNDRALPWRAVMCALDEQSLKIYIAARTRFEIELSRREEAARRACVAQQTARRQDVVDRARLCVVEALTRGQAVPCPGCGNPTRKDNACMHMTCGCGARFCYVCGLPRADTARYCTSECDSSSPFLENEPGWEHLGRAEQGEEHSHGALIEFHRRRMARLVRLVREEAGAEVWTALQAREPRLLAEVLEGRSIAWEEVDAAEHPCFGGGGARAALAAGDAAFREEVRALLAGVQAPAA